MLLITSRLAKCESYSVWIAGFRPIFQTQFDCCHSDCLTVNTMFESNLNHNWISNSRYYVCVCIEKLHFSRDIKEFTTQCFFGLRHRLLNWLIYVHVSKSLRKCSTFLVHFHIFTDFTFLSSVLSSLFSCFCFSFSVSFHLQFLTQLEFSLRTNN